ncbi:AcrR family transcriptional regulator [Amycolatopsis bartoniae]|uniref:TetR/AcrR family transcriptional regulator n=1 Tax=Amycolatopsis bartoniae TaxID=941986 RepID=UPI00183D55B8|nr:TetR family transcriptional regulator [Amycolatopsis bartoniae]MBB2934895.1 AcrR family transcriptional regulator [Amycolatopsis bartoniae]
MPRPRIPLISRHNALVAALEIMDSEGLEALSIRRLAAALGVNGASLYHHFASKEEILAGTVEIALAEAHDGREPSGTWREWLPENARNLRRTLLAHPALLPVVAGLRMHDLGPRLLKAPAGRLLDEGVPVAVVVPLLDALAAFVISSSIHETVVETRDDQLAALAEQDPPLARALTDRGLGAGQIFDLVVTCILDAIESAVEQQRARWTPMNPRGRRRATG